MTASAKDSPYLTWRSKSAPVQSADAQAPIQAPQVPVPPSPYGQVGDPYLHVLNWNAKAGTAPRQAQAAAAPMPRAPVQQPAPYATAPAENPQPYAAPRPNPEAHLVMQPYRMAQPMASTLPEAVPDGSAQAVARQPLPPIAVQTAAPPPVAPRPAAQAMRPAPQSPAPQNAVPRSPAPVQTQASTTDGAYQVPASSPYAARVNAARAAQAKAQALAQAKAQAVAAKPAQPAAPATAQAAATPAPAPAPAADADDKPFVPGEHYTDASEAPRLYSLHRAYGLKPDPITVDPAASGAILDTSTLDAAAAKAAKDEKADEDAAGDDPQADGVPSGSASASGTQNASASKKAAQ